MREKIEEERSDRQTLYFWGEKDHLMSEGSEATLAHPSAKERMRAYCVDTVMTSATKRTSIHRHIKQLVERRGKEKKRRRKVINK
jgi:hypothetical protein